MSERGAILTIDVAAVMEHLLPGVQGEIIHAALDVNSGRLRLHVHGEGLSDGETAIGYARGLQGRRYCVALGRMIASPPTNDASTDKGEDHD